ncbi:MAG: hypothetical protein K0R03_2501 [Moraxellaceae bacterium]|jgi:hypothetical protein|nr:hypothetical protein [Moraxellaceae bacterium]MDF3031943.1 hypothetical protein [Moraxellaceae bacterium]
MKKLLARLWSQLDAALDAYWLQLTVGQSTYSGILPPDLERQAQEAATAAADAMAGHLSTSPEQATEPGA